MIFGEGLRLPCVNQALELAISIPFLRRLKKWEVYVDLIMDNLFEFKSKKAYYTVEIQLIRDSQILM